MNLEWFLRNVEGKKIKIESVNTQGELGLVVDNLTVVDAEIKKNEYWDGYTLTINGQIKVCFEYCRKSEFDDIKHILCLYRSKEEFVYINLPSGDSWD